MLFNDHSALEGMHAFLGASKFHWINYDEEKLEQSYSNYMAAQRGTELHAFAAECIRMRQRLQKSKNTLNMFVNDSIGYGMTPEQVLYYSPNSFGTADAISFRRNLLRIHDYKSGKVPAHMEQLMIYAALFCLEYDYKPKDISMELRLYQSKEVLVHNPPPEDIERIMDKIVTFDKRIDKMKMGE